MKIIDKIKEVIDFVRLVPKIIKTLDNLSKALASIYNNQEKMVSGLALGTKVAAEQKESIESIMQALRETNNVVLIQEKRLQELEFERKLRTVGSGKKLDNRYRN